MFQVLSRVWPLLVGIVLIMLGNGMHFTLIGLRGGIEGFQLSDLAIVTSGYFMGFLAGARLHTLADPAGWPCPCLCGLGQFHVGRPDRIHPAYRALGPGRCYAFWSASACRACM